MPDRRSILAAGVGALPLAAGCAAPAPRLPDSAAREQIRASELAFAASMARRDLAAFVAHIAQDAVFINGGQPLRGKDAIVEHWSRFFKEPTAPFAWEPEIVEVGGQATLGYTEGPVRSGTTVVARFFSTWQRQSDGRWLVVFDNGYADCKR